MNKSEVAKIFEKQKKISLRSLSTQYENTRACQSFYNGNQMTYEDRIQFATEQGRRMRSMVNFNQVQPHVDGVVGFMAQNRRKAKFIARLQSSAGQMIYSRNMNALYGYHRENQNADQIETDQDADMMINGYGAIDTEISYIQGQATTDPNGEIIKARIDPMRVYWDPTCKDKNLLKARWCGYWDDYDLTEALKLFQGSTVDNFQKVDDEDPADTGYVFNPWGGLYDKIKMSDDVEWTNEEEDRVRVYNHQWMEYETFYRAVNPLYTATTPEDAMFIKMRLDIIAGEIKQYGPEGLDTGDMFDFDPMAEELTFDEKTKGILVKEFGDLITPVGFKRKCYYTAVISGKHVFTHFKSISQQGFSLKFKTGIYDETNQIWIGMVNSMMEPQKYYNKALTELMFTIAANSKGGVMVEEDAVEDISDFESKWAKTDAVIKMRSGALAAGKVQEKTRGAVPTGLENIITLSDAAISKAGVDPAFLGNLNREDQSGILYKRRIRQCISKMARYFDSITLYQKEDARLHGDLIPVWLENNNGKWLRICGEDGSDEFVQITSDMAAPEYDVSIQEAPQTPEDEQETAVLLTSMADKLAMTNPVAAQAFYAETLNMLPLDGDVRQRLMEKLQPQTDMVPAEQVQILQQQLQALQSQLAQAEAAKVLSEVQKNEALSRKAQAETASILEDAANKGLENDLIRSGNFDKVNVSI